MQFTFAVTFGPFFFSSASEPFGRRRNTNDPTIMVTASRNFILLSQTRTMKKDCRWIVRGVYLAVCRAVGGGKFRTYEHFAANLYRDRTTCAMMFLSGQ